MVCEQKVVAARVNGTEAQFGLVALLPPGPAAWVSPGWGKVWPSSRKARSWAVGDKTDGSPGLQFFLHYQRLDGFWSNQPGRCTSAFTLLHAFALSRIFVSGRTSRPYVVRTLTVVFENAFPVLEE